MKQNGILPSRGLMMVPVLMLPTIIGALRLALAPGAVPARVLVVAGTAAVAWYLLGGIFAGQRLLSELTVMRQVRSARRMLADEPGCAWIVDARGAIRAQSAEAERMQDMAGRDAAALLTRHRARPAAAAAGLLARVSDDRPARLPLGDGTRLTAAAFPAPNCNCGGTRPRPPRRCPRRWDRQRKRASTT